LAPVIFYQRKKPKVYVEIQTDEQNYTPRKKKKIVSSELFLKQLVFITGKKKLLKEKLTKTRWETIATGKDRIMGYRPGPGWKFKILF
jgi:hypothetical protein